MGGAVHEPQSWADEERRRPSNLHTDRPALRTAPHSVLGFGQEARSSVAPRPSGFRRSYNDGWLIEQRASDTSQFVSV